MNKIDGKVYPIPENEYVRAKFITSITNENIIDVVVQNSNEATVGVYEKGSDLMVGSIEIVVALFKNKKISFEKTMTALKILRITGWFDDYLIEKAMEDVKNERN